MVSIRFMLGTLLGLTAGTAGLHGDSLSTLRTALNPSANSPCAVYAEMSKSVRGRIDRDAVVMIKQQDGKVCKIRHRAAEVGLTVEAEDR